MKKTILTALASIFLLAFASNALAETQDCSLKQRVCNFKIYPLKHLRVAITHVRGHTSFYCKFEQIEGRNPEKLSIYHVKSIPSDTIVAYPTSLGPLESIQINVNALLLAKGHEGAVMFDFLTTRLHHLLSPNTVRMRCV